MGQRALEEGLGRHVCPSRPGAEGQALWWGLAQGLVTCPWAGSLPLSVPLSSVSE